VNYQYISVECFPSIFGAVWFSFSQKQQLQFDSELKF